MSADKRADTKEARSDPQAFLEAFRAAHERGTAAFNRGEWERAFAGVAPDFEFHPDPEVPDARIVRGRANVIEYFADARASFPDWRSDPVEYTDAGGGRIVVRGRLGGEGRVSGLTVDAEVFHVWETSNGVPVRMHEFFDRERAFAHAGRES